MVAQPSSWINEKKSIGTILQFNGQQYNVNNLPVEESAEQNYLGILMLLSQSNPDHPEIHQFLPWLQTDEFFFIKNATIFRVMQIIYERGEAIALDVVASELQKVDKLDYVGGIDYLTQLIKVNNLQLQTYANMVKRAAALRYIIATGHALTKLDAAMSMDEINALVERSNHEIQTRMMALSPNSIQGDIVFTNSVQQIKDEANDPNFRPGIPTGYRDLDDQIIGLRKKELITISAPTGWGKSMLLLGVSFNALAGSPDKRLLYIALEDDEPTLMQRIICSECMIDGDSMKRRRLSKRDFQAMDDHDARIRSVVSRLEFSAMMMPTLSDIKTRVMASMRQGIDGVIIDWLDARTVNTGISNENQATSEIFGFMRELKNTTGLPFTTAVQMNRNYSARKDQLPVMEDLAWSGLIEKVSDVVMFIHLPHKTDDFADPYRAEIVIRKNRTNGESIFPMRYLKDYSRFENWS